MLLDSYLKQKKTLTFVALCLLAFVSGLFKTVGFILPLILCFWLLKYKNYKEVAAIAVVFALSVGVYWLYGTHIDAEQFSLLLSLQSSRGFALDSIVTILTRPLFYEPFIDGWYLLQYVLLFGVWAVGTYTHKTRFIYTTAAFIAISIFLTIGQNNNFPWYKYPLFPFLSLATAQVALRVFAKPQLFSYFMFMLFLGVNAYLLFSSQAISAADTVLRFGFILLLLPPILYALWESTLTKRVTQIAFGGIIVISLLLNIAVVLTYPQSRCETTHCMLPIKMVIPN